MLLRVSPKPHMQKVLGCMQVAHGQLPVHCVGVSRWQKGTPRTSWPSSLTMRKSQGSWGVTGTSQASPYLLVMPIQSLSDPFICTRLIDP